MSAKKFLPSLKHPLCFSNSKLNPQYQNKFQQAIIPSQKRQDTSGSTFINDEQTNQDSFVFTIDAVVTRRNLRINSKLIQSKKSRLQNRMNYLHRKSTRLFDSQPSYQYFQQYIEKERARRVQNKFKQLLSNQKQKVEHQIRSQQISKLRTKLKQAIMNNKTKQLINKKKLVHNIKNHFELNVVKIMKRKQQSLEQNRLKRCNIMSQQLRAKDRRRQFEITRSNLTFNNLQQKIIQYEEAAKKTNILLNKLKQKQEKLQQKNFESIQQFNQTIQTIKRMQI